MYLHCHNCGWQQDDFWSESYNPIKSLQFWEKYLLKPGFDHDWFDSDQTTREVIINELEKTIDNINHMYFRTYEEYKNSVDKSCPQCGNDLDID